MDSNFNLEHMGEFYQGRVVYTDKYNPYNTVERPMIGHVDSFYIGNDGEVEIRVLWADGKKSVMATYDLVYVS